MRMPFFMLKQSADIYRKNSSSGEFEMVGSQIRCAITNASVSDFGQDYGLKIAQRNILHCESDVDVKIGDRVDDGTYTYRVVSIVNPAGLNHHLEVSLELEKNQAEEVVE